MEYMNEPVDRGLTSRIRQVFDNFEDPTADAGWQELRKKFPQRNNHRPLILWLSSMAAVLLLFMGLWFSNLNEESTAFKPLKVKDTVNRSMNGYFEKNSANTDPLDMEIAVPKIGRKANADPKTPDNLSKQTYATRSPNEQPVNSVAFDDSLTVISGIGPQVHPQKSVTENMPEEIGKANAAAVVLSDRHPSDPLIIQPANKPEFSIQNTVKVPDTEKKDQPSGSKTPKISYSLFAGSFINYSEGSESNLNFGAGFLSDLRLSKNFKLSTGLSLSANSLTYQGGMDLPESAASSFNSSHDYSLAGSLTTITSYNARLLALEVPLNIKYQFVPESDRYYISAGLSSGTYLNESYNYQYRNFNNASGSYINQTQEQKVKEQFNAFDLGRTLNLSFGLSSALGKTQTLSLEPFLKYPLGGLGSEKLRFGSTGVNLKLRFNALKK
jgi:hypothetical protein